MKKRNEREKDFRERSTDGKQAEKERKEEGNKEEVTEVKTDR